MKAWLTRAGDYRIAKDECPHPNDNVTMTAPPTGVLHTTEGGWSSAMSVFKQHYAPHFLVGPRRIAQLVPLGKMAAALENRSGGVETNRLARVQIEVCGYSKDTPYLFDAGTMDALASLLATLKTEANIPLFRPFPDRMPPLPWSRYDFSRRRAGKWGQVAGWYGHVEVPENSHWDPGALKWADLLAAAEAKVKPVPPVGPRYHIKLVSETGEEYVWDNNQYPGKTIHEFGVVAHKIRQGWIERR